MAADRAMSGGGPRWPAAGRLGAALLLGLLACAATGVIAAPGTPAAPDRLAGIMMGASGLRLALVKFSDGSSGSFAPGEAIPGVGTLIGGDAASIRVRRPDGSEARYTLEGAPFVVLPVAAPPAPQAAASHNGHDPTAQARANAAYPEFYQALERLLASGRASGEELEWSMNSLFGLPPSTRLVGLDGQPPDGDSASRLKLALDRGSPVRAVFEGEGGTSTLYLIPGAARRTDGGDAKP